MKSGGRREEQRRYVFGVGPVGELLRARPGAVERLWLARDSELGDIARAQGIPTQVVSRRELDALVGAEVLHQGVVAAAGEYDYADVDDILAVAAARGEPALVVALDGVTDPHNLGAILRSAYLFGAHGVVIPRDRAAPVNAVATKASAGASEHIRVAQVTNLARAIAELKEAGLWSAALAAGEGARPATELDGTLPLCLVLGSEGKGIRPLVARSCDFRVEIPMRGRAVGSLNVSVAAGVILYEMSRQRGQGA